jgi:hypothetical protein
MIFPRKNLSSFKEVTSSPFATQNVLNIVRLGIANSNRGEIFKAVPLVTIDDPIYYMKTMFRNVIETSFENLVEIFRTRNRVYYYLREAKKLVLVAVPVRKIDEVFQDKKVVYTLPRNYDVTKNDKVLQFIKANFPEILYI